jgi:hypothetical protein
VGKGIRIGGALGARGSTFLRYSAVLRFFSSWFCGSLFDPVAEAPARSKDTAEIFRIHRIPNEKKGLKAV